LLSFLLWPRAKRPTFAGVLLYWVQWQTHSFDSVWVPPFCTFMAIWCTLYLEFWKRRSATLAQDWAVTDHDEEIEAKALEKVCIVWQVSGPRVFCAHVPLKMPLYFVASELHYLVRTGSELVMQGQRPFVCMDRSPSFKSNKSCHGYSYSLLLRFN
jgi:hypothetical protein